jgi:error-prone DNA polymerase
VLAQIGALNFMGRHASIDLHRRDALWQSQKAAQPVGPLLEHLHELDTSSPLARMTTDERLIADYAGTGLSVDRHPLFYRRKELEQCGIKTASELAQLGDGEFVRVAGCVIARQRPGTAKGFIFMSLEDETGISNAIITPALYAESTMTVLHERFVYMEGILQNQDNVVHVRAQVIKPLHMAEIQTSSHDFH